MHAPLFRLQFVHAVVVGLTLRVRFLSGGEIDLANDRKPAVSPPRPPGAPGE